MPDDEIERLRFILARAHEQPPEFLPDLLRKVKEGFSHQVHRKIVVRFTLSNKKKPDA